MRGHPGTWVVLKKSAAVWPAVYQDVQSKLRTRFGMELVELRTRAEAELIISVSPLWTYFRCPLSNTAIDRYRSAILDQRKL
jgi:hypothetical protein